MLKKFAKNVFLPIMNKKEIYINEHLKPNLCSKFCDFSLKNTNLRSINPNTINHFASQSQTCQLFEISFLSQVELMRINFQFEAHIIQVHLQLITFIIY